ncbi:MAG: AMP-binding protein [Desulfobacteraceae bacterium]|nr:AMP-binding protein [Desulfobacteraceae bacterium]
MVQEFIIRDLSDIKKIEKIPYKERISEKSTFELIQKAACLNPDSLAITYINDADRYDKSIKITYKTLIEKITQTANMFHDLGVGPNDSVSYILLNSPEVHYILWGAETAGIANPINPLLEPDAICDICTWAKTKVIVTTFENKEIREKIKLIKNKIPTLEHIIAIDSDTGSDETINYHNKVEEYNSQQLTFRRKIKPDDIASLYHTGGTTGTPKLVRRTHYNEVFMAATTALITGMNDDENRSILSGLPLFHCNASIVTGLSSFSAGLNVVMMTSMGYRNPSVIQNFCKYSG